MSRQRKPTPARCRAPQQFDLFAGEPQKTTGDMPTWSGLPTETQSALTGLMARLILEHAQISSQTARTEAGDDH